MLAFTQPIPAYSGFLFPQQPPLSSVPHLFSFVEPGADTVFLDCLGSLELDFRLVISQETDCLLKIRFGINNHNPREMRF